MINKRRCSISKRYFERGYVILDGSFYAETEKHLIDILKNNVDFEGLKFLNNDDFLNFAYKEGLYYYTEFN